MNKKTLDPELTNINLFYKKDFYQKASNYLDIINAYSKELQYAIDYNLTRVKNDVITEQKNFFINMDSNMKATPSQFAAFWIKKFNNSLDEVKNQVLINYGLGTFYRNFSDSIGQLTRIENYFDDSTQLITDVNNDKVAPPIRYGSSLTNKISPISILLNSELSKKNNIVFRKNMYNIQLQANTPDKAHGDNLVPDVSHYQRISKIVTNLNQKIQSEFKELYNVIYFYCFYNSRNASNNLQFIPNASINISVEGSNLNQDLLFSKLQGTTSSLTTRTMLAA